MEDFGRLTEKLFSNWGIFVTVYLLAHAFALISHFFYKAKLFIHFKDLFFRFGVWILVVKNLHAFVVRVRSLTLGDGRPISSLRTPLTLLAQADLSLVLKSHSCSICCCFRIFRPLCYFYTFWLESDAYE